MFELRSVEYGILQDYYKEEIERCERILDYLGEVVCVDEKTQNDINVQIDMFQEFISNAKTRLSEIKEFYKIINE